MASPGAASRAPYVAPELIIAVLSCLDSKSSEGRRTIASCRQVCRIWEQLIHPLAFPDAVMSLRNDSPDHWNLKQEYYGWSQVTTSTLDRYILPLARTRDSMVVKRLTLKGLWTNAEMEQWSRAAIRVCEVYALVKELSNLEELTLYACSLHPCPHQNGCPFVGTYGLAKPLKRLDLDGVMVVPGNRDETPPRVSQSKDIFFLLESLNPNTLLVQGGRWSGSWESTDVTLPTKARSIHWVSSPIPTRFEVVEGLERLYAQPWIEHASLKRIIEGARASLTWVCLVCTLIGHDHHLPILALNQCTALSEANLWIKLTIPSGTSRFTSSAVWNLVESFVSQLPECTITLGLRLDIGDGAAYDAVGKFLSGGRWVEVVGGFLRTCLNRRANIEIRGLCQRRDGLQEDRLKALWLLQEIPAVFQEAGFANDRVRYIGFEKATSDLMTLQE